VGVPNAGRKILPALFALAGVRHVLSGPKPGTIGLLYEIVTFGASNRDECRDDGGIILQVEVIAAADDDQSQGQDDSEPSRRIISDCVYT
jgi:hypothetical protein